MSIAILPLLTVFGGFSGKDKAMNLSTVAMCFSDTLTLMVLFFFLSRGYKVNA